MNLKTFYKIFYRHRYKKASFILKPYLLITALIKYIYNLFYFPKKKFRYFFLIIIKINFYLKKFKLPF